MSVNLYEDEGRMVIDREGVTTTVRWLRTVLAAIPSSEWLMTSGVIRIYRAEGDWRGTILPGENRDAFVVTSTLEEFPPDSEVTFEGSVIFERPTG